MNKKIVSNQFLGILIALASALGLTKVQCGTSSVSQAVTENVSDWDYMTAYGGTGVWQVRKLRGTVRRDGKTFVIEAYDSRNRIAERITGNLSGSKIAAKRVNLASEPHDEILIGTYSQIKDGNQVYEVFSLSNEYWLVGVSRAKQAN